MTPAPDTIESGEYAPFSRPLFIYVSTKSLKRRQISAFVDFYLKNAGDLATEVGYVRLPKDIYARAARNVQTLRTGTQFLNEKGEKVHGPLPKVYK